MDSWLYDENQPFIHIEALETFEFLKNKVGTGYYEELIQKYLLDNTHGAIVVVRPEQGRTARLDAQLQDKLQKYKESLSEAEVEKLVATRRRWKSTSLTGIDRKPGKNPGTAQRRHFQRDSPIL